MRVVYFSHSLLSCWNHGNAHFLRGVLRELVARGHDVRSYEPENSWSRRNLLADPQGLAAQARFGQDFPDLAPSVAFIGGDSGATLDVMLDGADVVIVHEWTDPALVHAIGRRAKQGADFTLLFHDTHHRAVTDPNAIRALDLGGYDGVLAFGATLAEVYRRAGWGRRVFVWHEAADTRLFRPPETPTQRSGAVWIGNWGDDERSDELRGFLLAPVHTLALPLDVYGVRYPDAALADLAAAGATYRGWLPNARAPEVFARHMMTVHVPRRAYASELPGIPTIRMFEALACGIPLVSAPWSDSEGLFRPGTDYLSAPTPQAMQSALARLRADPELRQAVAASGLDTIRTRHTCAHRVTELLGIVHAVSGGTRGEPA